MSVRARPGLLPNVSWDLSPFFKFSFKVWAESEFSYSSITKSYSLCLNITLFLHNVNKARPWPDQTNTCRALTQAIYHISEVEYALILKLLFDLTHSEMIFLARSPKDWSSKPIHGPIFRFMWALPIFS